MANSNSLNIGDKTLKVALALGGGVSLGAFSGAAIGETLIWLNFYGLDKQKKLFKKVEIDAFSGASAGSISLLIMLRYLVETKATLEELERAFSGEEVYLKKAVVELNQKHNNLLSLFWTNGAMERCRDIVALKLMQDRQDEIWTEFSLDPFLDKTTPAQKRGGLLDRTALEDLALKHFQSFPFRKMGETNHGQPPVLGERVLFATTLTCLSPISYDARKSFNVVEALLPSLSDALTSMDHKDQRVFDLHFKEFNVELSEKLKKTHEIKMRQFATETSLKPDELPMESHPSFWIRAHDGLEINTVAKDLYSSDFWSSMTATSLASGAFPLAFDAVPLRRHWWEYGYDRWPHRKPFRDHADMLYVDGGVLDNEPIRKAFLLASFLDNEHMATLPQTEIPKTERIVLYVDPKISNNPEAATMELKLWSTDVYPEKYRLVEFLKSFVTLLLNQSKMTETNKIDAILQSFTSAQQMKELILREGEKIFPASNDLAILKPFVEYLQILYENKSRYSMLPRIPYGLKGEFKRVLWQNFYSKEFEGLEKESKLYRVKLREWNLVHKSFDDLVALTELKLACDPVTFQRVSQTLLLLVNDYILGLEGKDQSAQIIAISPFYFVENENGITDFEFIDLPAGRLYGFGGIVSKRAAVHASDIGKFCAGNILQYLSKTNGDLNLRNLERIPSFYMDQRSWLINLRLPKLEQDDLRKIDKDMKKGEDKLICFAAQVIATASSSSLVRMAVRSKGKAIMKSWIKETPYRIPVYISLPASGGDAFRYWRKSSVFGAYRAIEPISLPNGGRAIATFIEQSMDGTEWSGPEVKKNKLILYSNKLGFGAHPKKSKKVPLYQIVIGGNVVSLEQVKRMAKDYAFPCLLLKHAETESPTGEVMEGTRNSVEQRFNFEIEHRD